MAKPSRLSRQALYASLKEVMWNFLSSKCKAHANLTCLVNQYYLRWSYRFYHWSYDHTSLVRVKMKINIRIRLLTYSLWRPFKKLFTVLLCSYVEWAEAISVWTGPLESAFFWKQKVIALVWTENVKGLGNANSSMTCLRITVQQHDLRINDWSGGGGGRGWGFQLSPYAFSARPVSCDVTERDPPAKRERLGTRLKGFVSKEPVILCRAE